MFYILSSSSTKIVRTRSRLENLSKEELIEEIITVDDIPSKLSDVLNQFDDFLKRFEVVSSDVGIVQLERNAVTNAVPLARIGGGKLCPSINE